MLKSSRIIDILNYVLSLSSDKAANVSFMQPQHYYQPVFPYKLHAHPFFEWIWCIKNSAYLQVNEQVLRLDVGSFYLLPPGEMHADIFAPQQDSYQVLWCAYFHNSIGLHLHQYEPVNHLRLLSEISVPVPLYIASLLNILENEWNISKPNQSPICIPLIQTLIHSILNSLKSAKDDSLEFVPGKVAVRVNHYLYEYFENPLTLDDIAHEMCTSRNYLSTLYKQETGKTIGQMLREIRLEYAKKLLLETDMTVYQVSDAVGYSSPEHFSRIFTKEIGITPGKYGKHS